MVLRGHKTVVSLSDATRADGAADDVRGRTSSVDKLSSISINKEENGLFLLSLPNYIKGGRKGEKRDKHDTKVERTRFLAQLGLT